MKSASVEWNDKTLDEWIADPQRVIPGNQMTFAGIKDAKQRADLIAFLKQETKGGGSQMSQQGGSMGGMQALAWTVAYPDSVAAAIPIAATSRHSAGWAIVSCSGQARLGARSWGVMGIRRDGEGDLTHADGVLTFF